MEDPYITFKNDYIETGWWIIKTAFDKGLVYEPNLSYLKRI